MKKILSVAFVLVILVSASACGQKVAQPQLAPIQPLPTVAPLEFEVSVIETDLQLEENQPTVKGVLMTVRFNEPTASNKAWIIVGGKSLTVNLNEETPVEGLTWSDFSNAVITIDGKLYTYRLPEANKGWSEANEFWYTQVGK